jgi:hypothetical protein
LIEGRLKSCLISGYSREILSRKRSLYRARTNKSAS